MKQEPAIPDDDAVEEEYYFTYSDQMYDDISLCIKKFLVDYFGEQIYNLRSEIYRKIEAIIKNQIDIYGDSIPDILFRNRTITDENLWDEAYNKFEITDRTFPWPIHPQWYNREFTKDADGFLEDIPESELTEEQKSLKEMYDNAETFLEFHIGFAAFMKQGSAALISAMQSFIEDTVSFDLSILSSEGFEHLQKHLEFFVDSLFNDLYMPIIENVE